MLRIPSTKRDGRGWRVEGLFPSFFLLLSFNDCCQPTCICIHRRAIFRLEDEAILSCSEVATHNECAYNEEVLNPLAHHSLRGRGEGRVGWRGGENGFFSKQGSIAVVRVGCHAEGVVTGVSTTKAGYTCL